jgi:hypothetical protein
MTEEELQPLWVWVGPLALGVRLPLLGRGIFDTGANQAELYLNGGFVTYETRIPHVFSRIFQLNSV